MNELEILEDAEAEAFRKYREHPTNERLGYAWLEAVNATLAYKRA